MFWYFFNMLKHTQHSILTILKHKAPTLNALNAFTVWQIQITFPFPELCIALNRNSVLFFLHSSSRGGVYGDVYLCKCAYSRNPMSGNPAIAILSCQVYVT